MKLLKKLKWKKFIKWAVILIVLTVIGGFAYNRIFAAREASKITEAAVTTAKVETRDIQTVLSSSGSIEPLNTYDVKTLAEGEIIESDFEVGDSVKEGQVLYRISTDDLDSSVKNAETAVTRAEDDLSKANENYTEAAANYEEAKADYEEACAKYGDPDVKSTESGIVKTLFVKEGDKLQSGSQIAEIFDNSSMLLEVAFNAAEVDQSMVGKKAEVIMSDDFETLTGTVTKVSNTNEVLSGNRLVKTVTIRVLNPGGLTEQSTAAAEIGDIYSSGEGTFQVAAQTVIVSDNTGEIASLKIKEGCKVKAGDTILVLDQNSIEDQLSSYKKEMESTKDAADNAKENIEKAEETLEDAKTSLQDLKDSSTDYIVTAPISGQVITKDALTGDTINFNSALCTIYDLSSVKFNMSIDELDVLKVKVGQEVNVTADALEGVQLKGVVTNISLESTASQGVTQYPVTVKIDEIGDLLPGMNVTGEIILEKAEGVLAIPSDALMRGDQVYVADPTVKEVNGDVPAGFRAVQVETGITDGDYIEVKSGLTGNEELYVKRASGTESTTTFMPGGMMKGGDFNFAVPGTGGGMIRQDRNSSSNFNSKPNN